MNELKKLFLAAEDYSTKEAIILRLEKIVIFALEAQKLQIAQDALEIIGYPFNLQDHPMNHEIIRFLIVLMKSPDTAAQQLATNAYEILLSTSAGHGLRLAIVMLSVPETIADSLLDKLLTLAIQSDSPNHDRFPAILVLVKFFPTLSSYQPVSLFCFNEFFLKNIIRKFVVLCGTFIEPEVLLICT